MNVYEVMDKFDPVRDHVDKIIYNKITGAEINPTRAYSEVVANSPRQQS